MQSELRIMPEQASTYAPSVDALYFYLVGLTIVFSILISLLILYFAVKYRRRSEQEIPDHVEGSMKLETVWTVIPFIIAMSIFIGGVRVYFKQYRVPTNALDVYVVAKQWMWKFQHTDGQREINELHVPVGRRIKLTMATEDTIHSLFVPAFRVKMDVVPGRYSYLWFEPTKPGRYHLFCAEYCGTSHSGMIGWIEVMDSSDYEAWLSGGTSGGSLAQSGEKVFQQLACNTCHKSDGTGRGPVLEGVFGKTVLLANGVKVTADEAYIRESMLNSQAKIVAGFPQPSIMPTFQGQISEEQLLQLIEYIKFLGQKQAPVAGGPIGGTGLPASPGAGASTPQSGAAGKTTSPRKTAQ
jgi:cytochrome c oxidase subunit II